MAVLVTFTVSKYSMSKFGGNSKLSGCSFNVQEIVILADSETHDNLTVPFTPESTGLDLSRYASTSTSHTDKAGPSKEDLDKLEKLEEKARVERAKAFSSPLGSPSKPSPAKGREHRN
jgi:hypothetical protein